MVNVWRSRLERWLGPLAAATPLSPNAITLVALTFVLAAALCLAIARAHSALFLVSLPLLAIGGLLDAFDGIVARVQGKTSRFGDFLDHFADRVADLSLVCGWCMGAGIRMDLALLFLLSVSLNGYAGTQVEATFGVRDYDGVGRGEFVLALIILPLLGYSLAVGGASTNSAGGLRIAEWATVAVTIGALAGIAGRLRRAGLEARLQEKSPSDSSAERP